jgi:FAD/FMN-containing dehydrogenase
MTESFSRVARKPFARTSVSWSLGEFNAYLGQHQVFVPHGQCVNVHVGGHVQTGGYGQLGRSFGLFGDHVLSLEVVDHEGNFKEVTRASDPELFYAILGGSPGNLRICPTPQPVPLGTPGPLVSAPR